MTMSHISAEDGQWIVGATTAGGLVYRRGLLNCIKIQSDMQSLYNICGQMAGPSFHIL